MLENDIEVKVQELERCDSRCTKLYNENCQLVRKIKTLEGSAEGDNTRYGKIAYNQRF